MKLFELKAIFIAELILLGLIATPVFVLAQVEQQAQGVELAIEDGVPAQIQEPRTDPGFNWMWLLPLLVLPAIYIMYKRYEEDNQEESYTSDAQFRPEFTYHAISRKRRLNTAK